MKPVTFITGNLNKVKYLEKYLGHPIEHVKLDLDELQSLDPRVIVEHKVRQAYDVVHCPVLVEDASFEFFALGRLPGPFIRFFVSEMSMDDMCRLVDGRSRKAIARTTFGYFDGKEVRFFEGQLEGEVADEPAGDNGWDWDQIFIPEGYDITRAQMTDEQYKETSMMIRPMEAIKQFLPEQH